MGNSKYLHFYYLCKKQTTGMQFIEAFHLTGIVIGLATFIIIGIFHPIIIKAEYYFGTGCWWVFLLAGITGLAASIFVESTFWSAILAVAGASSLWGIGELFQQRKRVDNGWYPANPNRLNRRK